MACSSQRQRGREGRTLDTLVVVAVVYIYVRHVDHLSKNPFSCCFVIETMLREER